MCVEGGNEGHHVSSLPPSLSLDSCIPPSRFFYRLLSTLLFLPSLSVMYMCVFDRVSSGKEGKG